MQTLESIRSLSFFTASFYPDEKALLDAWKQLVSPAEITHSRVSPWISGRNSRLPLTEACARRALVQSDC